MYKYEIKRIETQKEYEGLKYLWCDTFGDNTSFVDDLYDSLKATGYIAIDGKGSILSALTLYKAGTYYGKNVFVSYAICTAPNARGQGIASRLTSHVKDLVLTNGNLSILSPAEKSLIDFYSKLTYKPAFFCDELYLDQYLDQSSLSQQQVSLELLTPSEYSEYREKFLSDTPHMHIDDDLLYFVHDQSADKSGFFLINKGDAVCTILNPFETPFFISELLVNPLLNSFSSEIDEELACGIAYAYGHKNVRYRKPGSLYCQSMIAGEIENMYEDTDLTVNKDSAYFGFPLD